MKRKLKRVDTLQKGPCDISAILQHGSSYSLFHLDRATEASVHADSYFDFSSGAWKTYAGKGIWYTRSEVFALDGTDEDVRNLIVMAQQYDSDHWELRGKRETAYEEIRRQFKPAFDKLREEYFSKIQGMFEDTPIE